MATNDHSPGTDQTDHHISYKHEIRVSVGDDHSTKIAITPTPSPRSTKSNTTSEVTSTISDENEILPRRDMNGQSTNGLDNPAFEKDKARPLSSFGQNGNGMAEISLKESNNGKPADRPLGKFG